MTASILVIGSGGREHALAWALARSPGVERVTVAPGNAGTTGSQHGAAAIETCALDPADGAAVTALCRNRAADLVVIGPEDPLAAGLADHLRSEGFSVFGPGADGARLEASKAWAKALMAEAGVPTAACWTATSAAQARAVLAAQARPLVVKADGLAAGKGVTVPETMAEAEAAIEQVFSGRFGPAGKTLVLEERLQGPELSVFALTDGKDLLLLPPAQDHKRIGEGDRGANTGGMGAYAPAPLLDEPGLDAIRQDVLMPTLAALRARGIDYRGVIYAGLMLTPQGPRVIEFNVRFGDPECEVLMPLLEGDLAGLLLACARGELATAAPLRIRAAVGACVVAAAAGYPGSVRRGDVISGAGSDRDLPHTQVFHAGTGRSAAGELVTTGGRVLVVAAHADSFDAAFALAYARLDRISFAGKVLRRDIGHQVRSR